MNGEGKKFGLVGKVILGVGVLASIFSGNAKADQLYVQFNGVPGITKSSLSIKHIANATEGPDGYDSPFIVGPSPAEDIYSKVIFDPYQLKQDSRSPESMSTINVEIGGRGLSNPINDSLKFLISNSDNNFANKNIFADLYNATGSLIETYDVKNMVSTGATIPLTISNGLSYTMDIRFEPNTFELKDLANFAEHWLQQCNVDNNKCDGLGEDGEYLNFIDFAYWANKWNPNN